MPRSTHSMVELRALRPLSALRDFLESESAGGLLLMAAAGAALVIANSPLSGSYFELRGYELGPLSLLHWINDGLMALFFLVVGLEIKREFVDGHLTSWADRRLPLIAAVSGMVVPALIYLVMTRDAPDLARGWAIPAATDIAFAMGIISLLGNRVPASIKLLLVTIAIADDVGAVVIIAIAYTPAINATALAAAGVIGLGLLALNRFRVQSLLPYLLAGGLLWYAVLRSGVHPAVAGVLLAMTIPFRRTLAEVDAPDSPLHRLEHGLNPWVAYLILPLFGFANAGVALSHSGGDGDIAILPLALTLALFLGKQFGIFFSIRAAVALGFAARPAHASWPQVYGMALLCGIGFTMSLFIGTLAFKTEELQSLVRMGVLGGSLLSAVAGFLVLRRARKLEAEIQKK
jgi:Na+:H+ antiporter, NhaA family